MRKGYLQKSLGLRWDNGLSELLSGKISSSDAIKTTSIENLDVVTRGQVPPNPSELLMPYCQRVVKKEGRFWLQKYLETPLLKAFRL